MKQDWDWGDPRGIKRSLDAAFLQIAIAIACAVGWSDGYKTGMYSGR